MKKWIIVFAILVVIAGAMYSIVWFIAVPKTAAALEPYRWRTIVPGERRESYHNYIGPTGNSDSSWLTKGEEWQVRRGNFIYTLHIQYNKDSLASSYSVSYVFKHPVFYKSGILAQETLQ